MDDLKSESTYLQICWKKFSKNPVQAVTTTVCLAPDDQTALDWQLGAVHDLSCFHANGYIPDIDLSRDVGMVLYKPFL